MAAHPVYYNNYNQQNYHQPALSSNSALVNTTNQYVPKVQPIQNQTKKVEITGRITEHKYLPGTIQLMKIKPASSSIEYICYCPKDIFAPMRQGDAVIAVCSSVPANNPGGVILTMINPPFVIIGTDQETIMQQIMRFLNKTNKSAWHAQQLYTSIASKIPCYGTSNSKSTDVSSFLDELSIRYTRRGDKTALLYLTEILGDAVAGIFLSNWFAQRALRRLYLLGLNRKQIQLISKRVKLESIYDKAIQNPYTLYEIPLTQAIEMCKRFKLKTDNRDPGCGQLIRHIYEICENNSDVGVPVTRIRKLFPWFDLHRLYLIDNFSVIIEHFTVYLEYPGLVERRVAKMIHTQMRFTPRPVEMEMIRFRSTACTEEQKRAVLMALQKPISIITGEGGTGKTTITNEIIEGCKDLELTYLAVSFTGAAVVRMRHALKGEKASTMDRAIAKAAEWKTSFQLLIIDEVSMVSTELMYRFISAFKFPFYVVFIGHKDQLQPISWGSFFQEIYKCQTIQRIVLTKNFRTISPNGQKNMIIHNCRKLLEYDPDPESDDEQFKFVTGGNFQMISGDEQTVVELITALKSAGITPENIRVICPYKKSVKQLNIACQKIWTGDNISLTDKFKHKWALSDLVYMTVNDYTTNVMNGEQGKIVDLTDKEISVEFSTGIYKFDAFPKNDPDNGIWNDDGSDSLDPDPATTKVLKLAYAATVHFAQGGEYDYGLYFIPEHTANTRFLDKTKIYVGISRFKILCYCVGNRETFEQAAIRPPRKRVDNLFARIQREDSDDEEIIINNKSVDPLKFTVPTIRPQIPNNMRVVHRISNNSQASSASGASSSEASSVSSSQASSN